MAKTTIIYIPGFGARYNKIRAFALRLWRQGGSEFVFFPLVWPGTQTLDQKFALLHRQLQAAEPKSIVLVGESAAGSAALWLYARYPEKVRRVVTICGKNTGADAVLPHYYDRSPAFRESMQRADEAVAAFEGPMRRCITVFYSSADRVVSLKDTIIDGASVRMLPAVGHLTAILLTLFILKRQIIKEATK